MIKNGLLPSDDALTVMRTILVNLVAIITFPFLFLFAILFITIQDYVSSVVFVLSSGLMLLVYLLNRKREFDLAKKLVLPIISALIAGTLFVFGRETDAHVLVLTMMIFVFIFYDEIYEWVLFGMIVFLSFLIPFIYLEYHDPLMDTDDLPYSHFITMTFALLACSLLSYVIIHALKDYLYQKDEALRKVELNNIQLIEKSNHIQRQKEELRLFTTLASHDLKTPIRTISSFLGLIERDESIQGSNILDYVNHAKLGAHQLAKLAEGISFLQSIENSDEKFPFSNSIDCIERIKEILNPTNDDSIVITFSPIPNLKISEAHFYHILKNLVENALTFNKSEVKHVQIEHVLDPVNFSISIKDNGIGINPQYADFIFQPFQKLHSESHYQSTGLGLSVCSKIINLYKGEIILKSSSGKGSEFWINIPKEYVC